MRLTNRADGDDEDAHFDDDVDGLLEEDEGDRGGRGGGTGGGGHGHSHAAGVDPATSGGYIVLVALSVHSVLEGIGLGSQESIASASVVAIVSMSTRSCT